MKRILVLALCAGALSACQKANETSVTSSETAATTEAPAMVDTPATPVRLTAPEVARRTDDMTTPASVPALAYRYAYLIETPAKAIDLLVAKHEAACQAAGPSVCQVTETNVRRDSGSEATGVLSLRARPEWLNAFRAGLAKDAEDAGGRLSSSNTATDDLSRSIVDTEATIRAQVIMRDRLETLLKTRTGKLDDLVEVEQQLAQVRGEIDAAQSNLAVMRNRVRMSAVTIRYETASVFGSNGAWAPVSGAIRASQGVVAGVVSILIYAMAVLAPLAALGGVCWFAVRAIRKRRRPVTDSVQTAPSAP